MLFRSLTDTAGLRETGDIVEKLGIEKTWESIKEADITLIIVDVTDNNYDYENKLKNELPKDNEIIIIRNKIDLLKQQSRVDEQNNVKEIFISAKK